MIVFTNRMNIKINKREIKILIIKFSFLNYKLMPHTYRDIEVNIKLFTSLEI